MHKFSTKIHVPTDFDHSDTLQYTMITISDSIIVTPMASSSGRVDIMSKISVILLKVPFFGMISTLPLEVYIGTLMVLSGNVIRMYYKVYEPSK